MPYAIGLVLVLYLSLVVLHTVCACNSSWLNYCHVLGHIVMWMWVQQVEADIRPFRGILLGLFFVTTGSSLDLTLLFQQWPIVLALTGGLISVKVGIIGSVAPLFGLSKSVNPQTDFSIVASGC